MTAIKKVLFCWQYRYCTAAEIQSDPTELPLHMSVNNLPTVSTWKKSGGESDKSMIRITLPRHLRVTQNDVNMQKQPR